MSHTSRRRFIQGAAALTGMTALRPSLSALGATTEVTAATEVTEVHPAPMMPIPRFIETNGIQMAVYDKGEGLPLVFCHGFPELAFSWRHQVKALSQAGYRTIAPDQRGYGLTSRPEAVSAYEIQELTGDLVGMLDVLEVEKAVFVGHDWGGGVVWAMPRIHPDRVAGVIGLNTPASRPPNLPAVTPSEPSLIVMGPNYYALQFQVPGRAEAVLEENIRHSFDVMLSRGGIWNKTEFAKLPEDSPERQMDLLALIQKPGYPAEAFLSEDEISYFVSTFTATGFTGGLNWYRAAMAGFSKLKPASWTIDVPCLYIGAENDVILPPSSADGMEDFIPNLEKHIVMGSGHWTQQEKPDEVNRVIGAWLNRHFA